MKLRRANSGFTLVETLGIAAIIVILAAIAIVGLNNAVRAAQESAITRQVQGLNTTYQNYLAAGGIPHTDGDASGAVQSLLLADTYEGGLRGPFLVSSPPDAMFLGAEALQLGFESLTFKYGDFEPTTDDPEVSTPTPAPTWQEPLPWVFSNPNTGWDLSQNLNTFYGWMGVSNRDQLADVQDATKQLAAFYATGPTQQQINDFVAALASQINVAPNVITNNMQLAGYNNVSDYLLATYGYRTEEFSGYNASWQRPNYYNLAPNPGEEVAFLEQLWNTSLNWMPEAQRQSYAIQQLQNDGRINPMTAQMVQEYVQNLATLQPSTVVQMAGNWHMPVAQRQQFVNAAAVVIADPATATKQRNLLQDALAFLQTNYPNGLTFP